MIFACILMAHCFCKAALIENDTLSVSFNETNGAFAVTDRRTGRIWTQQADEHALQILSVEASGVSLCFKAKAKGVGGILTGCVLLEGETVRASLDAPATAEFDRVDAALVGWPCGFTARKGDRILIPHGSGFSFAADQTEMGEHFDWRMHGYSREWRMAMWGQYSESVTASGEVVPQDGYLAVVETPCNTIGTYLKRANGLMGFQLLWENDLGAWGHQRNVRFEFMTKAGPMEMALRYREEMKRKGYYKTFAEKARERPKMAKSFRKIAGAPSIWYWAIDGKKAEVCRALREECGFGDFLFQFAARKDLGTWVTPEEVKACAAAAPGVILSEYDMYLDTMDSKYIPLIAYVRPYWSTEAADNGDVIRNFDGTLRRGWKVAFKGDADGAAKGIGCATTCEQKISYYVRKRLANELKKTPEYNARYLDGMGCIEPLECYDAKHRMSRRECVERRREMMAIPGNEFSLLASTEDGPDYLASVCDYFTCGFSAANDYRVDGGRWMWKIYEGDVPDEIRRGTDETTRMPIFEMVYHGCCVSYWDWCDYNNKFTKIWWKRDLFNALCGTPPLYFFNEETWPRFRGMLKRSYNIATPVAIATYSTPMTAYRILTPDRRVHQVEFANGVVSTVNFGDRPFVMKDGYTLQPHSHHKSLSQLSREFGAATPVYIDNGKTIVGRRTASTAFARGVLEPQSGDVAILPFGEGMAYPVEEEIPLQAKRLSFSNGQSLSMGFYGRLRGDEWMMFGVRDTLDAGLDFSRTNGMLRVAYFGPTNNEIRVFRGKSLGDVAAAYRVWRERMGHVRTLAEKLRTNPNLRDFPGTADFWLWDDNNQARLYNWPVRENVPPRDTKRIADEMKSLGLDRVLWNSFEGETAEDCAYLKKLGYHVGTYDCMRDVFHPGLLKVTDPGNFVRNARFLPIADSVSCKNERGEFCNAWSIPDKAGKMHPMHVLCDMLGEAMCRRFVAPEIAKIGYDSRLMDVQAGNGPRACFAAEHPCTMREGLEALRREHRYLCDDLKQITGVEVGCEALVDAYHYSEGLTSCPHPFRKNLCWRYKDRALYGGDVPHDTRAYLHNPRLRIPLWELVYHDCTVSYYYWADSTLMYPELSKRKDLFCALYGLPPIYSMNVSTWNRLKLEVAASYARATTTARKTAFSRMTGFRWLSADKLVQETHFANGVGVVVNFGTKPFALASGQTIPAESSKMIMMSR